MWMTMAQVALGAALGGAARFGVGHALLRATGPTAFPLGVIVVNVVGSFLMGVLVVWAAHRAGSAWLPFLATGILGGFTTFSAFSLETMTLIERGQMALAASYVIGSVVLSVIGLFLGVLLARGIWA